MKLYDNDAYRDEFMEAVYNLLSGDTSNDRANQVIDLFDAAPAVEAESVLPNEPLTLEQLRKMDREPVWWWNTTQKPTCTICISASYIPEPIFVTYDFAAEDAPKLVKYNRMKKWGYKPYRRRPEV